MFARKFPEPAHIFVAINTLESEQGPRELRIQSGNRQADARSTVINCQDGCGCVARRELLRFFGHLLTCLLMVFCPAFHFARAPNSLAASSSRLDAFLSAGGPFRRATSVYQAALRGRQGPKRS